MIVELPLCVTTPILRECEDENSHSRNGNLGVHLGSRNFRKRLQGSKHLALGSSLYHWKDLLKCRCLKWACMTHLDICNTSYGKTKGRESNWQFDSQPQKVGNQLDPCACRQSATYLGKLLTRATTCFRPHPDRRSKQRVIVLQNCGSLNLSSFGTPLWEFWDEKPFKCRCHREAQRILYGGGGGFPRIRAVVNFVGPKPPMTCPTGAPENELTNLLVNLIQI